MKVAAITGKGQGGLTEKPCPKPRDNIVVVKVKAVPMCTEYKAYVNGWCGDSLGHEAAGEVAEIAQPCKVTAGQRVVVMPQTPCGRCELCLAGDYIFCQHTFDIVQSTGNSSGAATYAQYLLKPDWLLIPIPDDLSFEHAAMACCGLGPTFNALQQMNVGALDTVLITGLGPVGLGGVINATLRGARVIGVDGQPYRARLARDLGAAEVLDPADPATPVRLRELTGGRGVDAAVDCSGVPAAQRLMIGALRRRGQAAFVGEGGEVPVKVSDDMIRNGITLRGIWHWNLGDTFRMLEVIRRSRPLLDKLITHRLPMSEVTAAWQMQVSGNCGKIVLDPWA